MITSEIKDQILIKMTLDKKRSFLTIDSEYTGLEFFMVEALMNRFKERGFIQIISEGGKGHDALGVTVTLNADDFLRTRGHVFEEKIFSENIKKLELEIKKLEKDIPADKFDIVTKAISAVSAGIGAYVGMKGI